MTADWDVIIIGAGAAGLMCAAQAGYRGRKVLVLDNAKKIGRKILISGGGKCNFTNQKVEPANYICQNPHFAKSALSRFSHLDFIDQVERHGIDYEERDHGQLFCLEDAKQIVSMLTTECDWAQVTIQARTEILDIERLEQGYRLKTSEGTYQCESLVIATGGLSMPKLGATAFGYQVAQQFGLEVFGTRAGLVPFTLHPEDKSLFAELSGIAVPAAIRAVDGTVFEEALLITHRGFSGPSVLQISNYWQEGEPVYIDWLPGQDLADVLQKMMAKSPKQALKTALGRLWPKRLAETLMQACNIEDKPLNQYGERQLQQIAAQLQNFEFKPAGTEGYRTAEVTLGGVDTDAISSKTFEVKTVPGLYFIGEVLDVTGWLGGYNFQWCWSSGWCCGQYC